MIRAVPVTAVAAVMSARVIFPVFVTVVIAFRVGIEPENSLRQRLCGHVRRSRHAAVERDPRFRQRVLRAHTDAAADEGIDLRRFQKARQRAVTASVTQEVLR